MVVEVKQQHVSYEAHDEPRRRFEYFLESWSHEERIPHRASLSEAHSRMRELRLSFGRLPA